MVYGMTYRRDCGGAGKAVILHSEIGMTTASPPALSRREGAGRRHRIINKKMNRIMNMTKRMRMHGYSYCQNMMMAMM